MAVNSKPPKKIDETSIRAFKIQMFASVANNLIKWGGLVGIVYMGIFLPIDTLAGGTTVANIAIDFLGSFRINTALAWVLGGGGMAYGWRERRLRQRNIERLEKHIRKLETKRDKRRSSSSLTPKGKTNPGDDI